MSAPVTYAFLHGGGQGGWVWQETIEALRRQTEGGVGQALTLDVPGCGGKRGRDTQAIGVDDIAAELVADLEGAGAHDVVLVGHSQAGCILPRMAKLRPSLFRRMIYVSCSSPTRGQTVMSMIGAGLHGEHPDEVGWPVDPKSHTMEQRYPVMFCNDMTPPQAQQFMAKVGQDAWPMQSYTHTDWTYDHLDSLAASYVICLRDNILPPDWQLRFAQRFRAGRLVRIDAGHQVMNTRPHALAEALRIEAAAD